MTRTGLAQAAASLLLLVVSPAVATAHPMPGVGDFYAGMLHPVAAIDFLLPLMALGLLAGQQPRPNAIAMLAVTPIVLTIGAIAALLVPLTSSAVWINLLWMSLLGVLVAWAPRVPVTAIVVIAAVPALTVGWAIGGEIGERVSALRFISGIALSGLMLMTYGAGGIRRLQAPWTQIAIRVVGSWIAAVGLLVLSLR